MVYCGKPSKGCQNCRARKIRCDQIRPACTQCTRVGKECSGYRNMLDLVFRDESEAVVKKIKAKARASPPRTEKTLSSVMRSTTDWPTNADSSRVSRISGESSSSSASSAASPEPPNSSLLPSGNSLWSNNNQDGLARRTSFSLYSMFPTVEECGINFFVANFVSSAHGPSHGYFNYVPELCSNGGTDDILKASMSAAGLGGLANIAKSSQMMTQARREYATALRKINKALRSPSEAVKDSTLLSIIILSIFETTAGGKQLSLREWTEHINGAATLVKLRGSTQLCNPVSFSLFIHATSHLLISCLLKDIPMPKQIIDLRNQAMKNVLSDPGWIFLQVTDQITVFRSEVLAGTAGGLEEIISKALEFDLKLARIFSDAPLDWLYEIINTDEESDVLFDGCYHIYYDIWIAQLWNAMRITRIMLNEIIRSQLLDGFTAIPPVFTVTDFSAKSHNATNIIIQLRDDILHSVPQHLGYINRKPFRSVELSTSIYSESEDFTSFINPPSQGDLLPFDSLDFSSISTNTNTAASPSPPRLQCNPNHPTIGGYFLLWPLFVSGITRTSTPTVRTFAARMLHYIGEKMGIRQGTNLGAFMMATPLTSDEVLKDMKRLRDHRPIGPLKEMLRRDDKERVERGREAQGLV